MLAALFRGCIVVLGVAASFSFVCLSAQGDPSTDDDTSRLREKATTGDAEAQYLLGSYYALSNPAEAVRWFRKAAEQGFAKAQLNLALSYSSGRGVPQNYAEAVNWLRKAAEQGNARAQFFLATDYAYGSEGLPQDYVRAYVWFSLAAAISPEEYTIEVRDQVARKLTPAQLAAAQAIAKQCLDTNYVKCGPY